MSNVKNTKFPDTIGCKLVILKKGRMLIFQINKFRKVGDSIQIRKTLDDYLFFWKLLFRNYRELRIYIEALSLMKRTSC